MQRCPLELAYLGNRQPANGLTFCDVDSDTFRALSWLPTSIALEVLLDGEPVGTSLGGIKEDQDDGHFLSHPQIVIQNVQVIHIVCSALFQCLHSLELKVNRARLGVALFVESANQQVVAVVAAQPLGGVAFLQDEPLHVVNAEIRDYVLPCPLLAWTKNWVGHKSS